MSFLNYCIQQWKEKRWIYMLLEYYLKEKYKINKPIEDIIVVGGIDKDDEVIEFRKDLRFLYFKFDTFFLKLKSVNQYSKLELSIVDKIAYDYEIDGDEVYAKTSVFEIILNDPMSLENIIKKMFFYNLEEDNDSIICDALEMVLENGQCICIDPSFLQGINIGGIEIIKQWKDNYSDRQGIEETILEL